MAGKRSSRIDPGNHLPVDPPFRLFVTGTDTGVGKTEAACALLSLLARRGLGPAAFKPYESGCRDLRAPGDACALREAAQSKDELNLICPHRFELPLAPGIAARRLRRDPPFQKTLRAFKAFANRPLVVEGAGGLHVPIDSQREVIDLIHAFRLSGIAGGARRTGNAEPYRALARGALQKRRGGEGGAPLLHFAPELSFRAR